ncbi:MAG: hypothetical protein D6B25_13840 [Desulfobulbaceae bacterium]|nr:MAG: hypothetical protein D6B25_13840 [Desulfobulbaceae bacterium]
MVDKNCIEAQREVTILLTDMVGYTRETSSMSPEEVRDFIIKYHQDLAAVLKKPEYEPVEIEPSAGDGALILFGKREQQEDPSQMCRRAIMVAIELTHAIRKRQVVPTRMGLFKGDIIEAQIGSKTAKFGTGFAIANRLEELCDYFGTSFLMDRDVANTQDNLTKNIVQIGKVTPQNINHPIHLQTIYAPGLHRIPEDADLILLQKFINLKNEAMEYFCGNEQLSIQPDFPKVRRMLEEASGLFQELSGTVDIASERILEYIRETPYPSADFRYLGMKIHGSKHDPLGVRLLHLSKELLKAIDIEFYNTLVVETTWENLFALEWRKQGDVIIKINETADGIYYIDSGTVVTVDSNGKVIATLGSGNIFGEMAYFSKEKRRNATVVAASDVVLRKISTVDFKKFPVIQKIFQRIASQRKSSIPTRND